MKYLRLFVFFCFVLCVSGSLFVEVNAATLGTNNVCSSEKKSISIGEGKCQDLSQGVIVTSDTDVKTTTVEVPITVVNDESKAKYYVIALIDTSTSMKAKGFTEGSSSKIELLNTVFKKFADKIYSANSESVIKYIYFNAPNSLNSYKHGADVLSSNNLNGSTLTQRALKKAYNQLKKLKSSDGYTPMVALFTDGYPNQIVFNYGVTEGYSFTNGSTGIGNWYSSRMAYYTLLTMKSLRDNLPNLKFFTFGIGMSKEDSFAKYLLWPTEENYNKLSIGTISTESKRLKNILDKKSDDGSTNNKKYYELVAELRGDGISNPEYGFFRGIYSTETTKIDGKKKNVSVVNFDFSDNSGASVVTKEFLDLWSSKKLWFYFPNSNLVKNNIYKVEYSTDGGKSWSTINKSRQISRTSLYAKSIFVLKKNANTYSTTNLTNIKFTFNKEYSFSSYSINSLSYKDLVNVVDYSYVGDDLAGFEKMINENIFNGPTTITTTKTITTETSFTKNTYEPCSDYSTLSVDYYVETVVPLYEQTLSGSIDSKKYFTCSPVSVTVPTIITDEVNFNFGNIKDGFTTYNGGSFPLNGISVTNKVKWYYRDISTNEKPMFTINYKYKKKADNGPGYENVDPLENVEFGEVKLYSDSSCTSEVAETTFESAVWNAIKNNKIEKDKSYEELIESVDTNTGESNSPVEVVSTDNSAIINNSKIQAGGASVLNLTYNISLPTAWLNSKTQEVIYGGSNPDESIYLNAGSLRYTPLKYDDSLPVSLNSGFNFSVVDGITIKPANGTSCSIKVEPNIYVPDGNGGYEFNVKYRSISVSDPFPKSIPKDWQSWYSNVSNQQRIKNSYNNYPNTPLYKIVISNDNSNFDLGSSLYTDWNGIDLKGQSEFVSENFVTKPQGSNVGYCGLGKWSNNCS